MKDQTFQFSQATNNDEPRKSAAPSLLRPPDSELETNRPKQWLEFRKPSELINFVPPKDFMLAGNCHLTRGGITVLGGAPGVGKSRAALGLAIAGATGRAWMGYPVHSKFKTLVIQAENGPYRLKGELSEIAETITEELDDFIMITPPPTFGLAFGEEGFRQAVRDAIKNWQPGLVIIDPWNRATQGDKQADAQAALDGLFACLPEALEERPAILIVHHLRKKGADHQRKQGRDLLHELAGTYQIGSSARCVFALEPASTSTEDDTVVLTCCKNNDGIEGAPSAWHRGNGLFERNETFDMEEFLAGAAATRGVSEAAIKGALESMAGESKKAAVQRLMDAGVCGQSKAYQVLKDHPNIEKDNKGKLYWRAD